MWQERKHLAFQLKDTKTVVSKLERIFAVIIHLLFIMLYLVIFDVCPPAPRHAHFTTTPPHLGKHSPRLSRATHDQHGAYMQMPACPWHAVCLDVTACADLRPSEQVDVNKVWITFSSIILAFSFVFSNSIRDMYAAVIFLFVVHPFDVGDALMIGAPITGSGLNQLVWVRLSACSTLLRRDQLQARRGLYAAFISSQ